MKLLELLPFLPLSSFLITYRCMHDWQPAFIVGGVVSLVYMLLSFKSKIIVPRFLLAINLFLLGGTSMYVFNLIWLQNLYDSFLYTTLFLWMCIVGVVTTLFSKAGFIGIDSTHTKAVRLASFSLLFATIIATLVSWYFNPNFLLAAVVPFSMLMVTYQIIAERL